MGITIDFTDNSAEILRVFDNAAIRGLEACGSAGEGYAKDNLTASGAVDTGRLRNSVNYGLVDDRTVQIGTNTEHGPYIELGTGKYATTGGGTPKERWVYMGDDGKFHMAFPQVARPYLKPAVSDHGSDYQRLIKSSMENA
ncbi:MAG: HK97 gp10 family phage protein [Oscillospiraceae bacterium]|nr:HK97 gp10 family phage protein [Oscillospiraceae bacterium]